MLAKKNKADKKTIEKIFKEGRFITSPTLTFKFLLSKKGKIPQISFIVPKNTAKLAVKRNFLRRLGYQALKKHLNNFPAQVQGVFVFKKEEKNISTLENDIEKIQHKIN